MNGSNNLLSWVYDMIIATRRYDSYLDIFFSIKMTRLIVSAFIFHITHDEFPSKIKICQIQLLLRIQWLFILNEIYARTEEREREKRGVVWHLNVNVVTAKLRWNLGSVYQITENSDTVNHSKYHVVFFIFLFCWLFVRTRINDEMKQHVEKIHTVPCSTLCHYLAR